MNIVFTDEGAFLFLYPSEMRKEIIDEFPGFTVIEIKPIPLSSPFKKEQIWVKK